ncbi:glutaminase family protein [Acidipila sp. EB88]|uniref:glutaminase family protein n=1 Tax=Acidipila sp. EB88 TaxID=2305226 RepID=UPI000F5FC1F6|nr:glutaminase family protein [Acidipila sp. EB88]RRA48027.1 DUF4965 domain-containing protein [Acidipila sp. EB88]
MKSFAQPCFLLAASLAFSNALFAQQPPQQHRPPAVPLVTHNPYFSIWSDSDKLTDSATRHWTGSRQPLTSMVRIDGHPYRIMGGAEDDVPALPQSSVQVDATHTDYVFQGSGIELHLAFFTPAFPQDMALLSRPVSYLTWTAKSLDGAQHSVDVLFDVDPVIAVNDDMEASTWGRSETNSLAVLNTGSRDQQVLGKRGDDLRIDWGYFHLAVPRGEHADTVEALHTVETFAARGTLPTADSMEMPATPRDGAAHLSTVLHLGSVGAAPVSQHVLVGYTEGFALEYLNQRLRPYWQRDGKSVASMLDEAEQQYSELEARGRAYDSQLHQDLAKAGGEDYAYLATLAYRESLAAHALTADSNGTPLLFAKENFSNGDIGTVDVLYPSAPIFLFFNPALLEAQVEPVLRYATLPRWRFPFAPHDLGRWPLANGQDYGGGEETEDDQMPVEESGDLLILADALAQAQGNAHVAEKYWPLLTRWADYLTEAGLDPANQLSTDDFAGHLAHNANLSIKAIDALGAYADMAKRLGHADVAAHYRATAEKMAAQWQQMAGDPSKLAFDKQGSWSQKYNLVWDQLLGLHLFPETLREHEVRFYLTQMHPDGVPLDSRKTYTKLDWELWSATMAGNLADFQKFTGPMVHWADTTQSRVPMTDWYDTVSGLKEGFQARSVVGGLFIKALADDELTRKWRAMAPGAAAPGR